MPREKFENEHDVINIFISFFASVTKWIEKAMIVHLLSVVGEGRGIIGILLLNLRLKEGLGFGDFVCYNISRKWKMLMAVPYNATLFLV